MAWTRRGFVQAAAAISAGTLPAAWLRAAEIGPDGTLTVALSDNPLTCDPINMASHDSMIISQNIWENLVEFDIDGILKPQLAKALPVVSADKLTYSFELRDDVAFQNGQELTSADVKYSFEYMLDPAHKAARRPIFKLLSHVEIDGPHQVRVILKEPYAPWLYFLTKHMGIWPAGSRDTFGDDYFRRSPKGLGTGPGIFEEWKPNDYISLVRNPHYWQKGKPAWQRLVVKVVPEDATRVAYLLGGQADIIGAPPARDFARLQSRPHIHGETLATLGGWSALYLNNAVPPFDDIDFRRALAHAVDRKTIAAKIFYGLIEPTAIPAPPSGWWYDETADRSLDYDLDKARYYLQKSKYAEGASFELATSSVPYLFDGKDCAVFLQSEFAKLGIEVRLRLADNAVLGPAVSRGEYQAAFRHSMSPGEPTYLSYVNFTPNQFSSLTSNYTNPKLDALFRVLFAADDDREKLKPIYAELLRLLADQSPYVWVGFFSATNLWRDRVKNFRPSRGMTINVRDVALS